MNKLFDELMKLCERPSSCTKFYYKDDITGMGTPIRIFSYFVAEYSDWVLPGALECRGIMFEMDGETPVRIMARPMEKFFNVGENSFSSNLDYSDSMFYMTKEDGSLISTFFDKGVLGLKSKASIYSDQVYWAAQWINDHPELKDYLRLKSELGFTINMEYVGPKNRIVLGYDEPALRILNVRENETGEYVDMREIYADAILRPYLVDVFDSSDCSDEWIEQVRAMEGIEGYVIAFPDKMVKIKTDWYVKKHYNKESINNNRRLTVCCIENSTDDLRGLFVGDHSALQKITDFERKHIEVINEWFSAISEFHSMNKQLGRKDYAISASSRFRSDVRLFDIAMTAYDYQNSEEIIKRINDKFIRDYNLIVPEKYK